MALSTSETNQLFRGRNSKIRRATDSSSVLANGLAYEFPYNKQLEIKKRFFKIRQKQTNLTLIFINYTLNQGQL